jgi:hypothetical protein
LCYNLLRIAIQLLAFITNFEFLKTFTIFSPSNKTKSKTMATILPNGNDGTTIFEEILNLQDHILLLVIGNNHAVEAFIPLADAAAGEQPITRVIWAKDPTAVAHKLRGLAISNDIPQAPDFANDVAFAISMDNVIGDSFGSGELTQIRASLAFATAS